jgi:hypothetical protein
MTVQDVLDRMTDRIMEMAKEWSANGIKYDHEALDFDLDLLEKDIEWIRDWIRRRREK